MTTQSKEPQAPEGQATFYRDSDGVYREIQDDPNNVTTKAPSRLYAQHEANEKVEAETERMMDIASASVKLAVRLEREACAKIADECGRLSAALNLSQARVKDLETVAIDALKDDYFHDHSSGCWQPEAQKILGVACDDDESKEYFESLEALKEAGYFRGVFMEKDIKKAVEADRERIINCINDKAYICEGQHTPHDGYACSVLRELVTLIRDGRKL